MNIANKLTLFRVILIPFFLLSLYIIEAPYGNIIGVIIFIIASLTDFLDGHLARSRNLVTDFGKFMDPLADKLLVASALIYLVEVKELAAWIVIVIIGREFIISGVRLVAANKGIVIAAGWWGKIKTMITMIMIIVILCNFNFEGIVVIEQILIYASLLFTVISALDYITKNINIFKE
ncbi:CDP-diacylglycerol--glycerol-3-phosphate 3-phosphatidyltransferase [Vallitalea guaymasensis]|uniref:CDP-diacylglycerol--glycerol-3-phosphate 3-phosphatidyltransferase n=1 Tax=Vallitalea guaymasensis TaxID=1185412 RepID=A0A8J8MF47_9FIRM|nr:CDP-diacylglycerol--glycerol-3-phosphate 3-phosphatidyltransferase [Vallitalea guaymasensis]QUH31832.1 CDP-diacylglycerol--glycerol-3-phosphate 3-phosphatidyltransferase [Vallitalea guaymasensis]